MSKTISIDGRVVGYSQPAFIISEAGVNHNGSPDLALELIKASAQSGADCVKFQTFRAERVAMEKAPKAAYQLEVTDSSESQIEMLKSLELPEESYPALIKACYDEGITFLSTPYNEEDVDFLVDIGAPALKMASIHAAEPSMLRYAAKSGLPLIVSTGMATLEEVAIAVNTIRDAGNDDFILLQCTTNYPAASSDANLRAIPRLAEEFNTLVGYSDHTQSETSAIAAIALGACVIEKHFTIDTNLPGPDQSTSLDSNALRHYVNIIREAESALGTGNKTPSPNEIRNIEGMRRSIVVRHSLPKGHTLTDKDLILKRPATGIAASKWDAIVGLKTTAEIDAGSQLRWEDIQQTDPVR
ncbi:MAG: N-acetylneuraminate synthase family protein [Rhodospirillaceae bacterium]